MKEEEEEKEEEGSMEMPNPGELIKASRENPSSRY